MPCGIESIAGMLGGSGEVRSPSAHSVGRDYLGFLNDGYAKGVPSLFNTEKEFQPQYTNLALEDWNRILPALSESLKNLQPGQNELLDRLTASANDDLSLGADIDPELERVFQQSVRGGQSARGLGRGPSDVFDESMGLTQLANTLRQQRRGFASDVAGLNYNNRVAPTLASAGALSSRTGSQLLTPANSLQLLMMPYQGRLQAASASAGNATSLLGQSSANSNWT